MGPDDVEDVLTLWQEGLSTREIAQRLGMDEAEAERIVVADLFEARGHQ